MYPTETEQRFQIGFQVGDVARSLHPDGILIDTPDAAEALALTRKALAEHPDRPLFEAAFQRDGVLVRADLLLPEADGYRLREVKASTRVKDEHREDCAIQAWVIGAALPLTGVELAHVDTAFVYPGDGDYHGLLKSNPLDGDVADPVCPPCPSGSPTPALPWPERNRPSPSARSAIAPTSVRSSPIAAPVNRPSPTIRSVACPGSRANGCKA